MPATEPITVIYTELNEPAGKKVYLLYGKRRLRSALLTLPRWPRILRHFCKRISDALTSAAETSSGFTLKSFEVTIEISARGEVRLIGSASSEVRGGVKLIFTRVPGAGDAS